MVVAAGQPCLECVELPARRRVELPADPADGVRLRRRLGGVHRRTGLRAHQDSRQRVRSSRPRSSPTRCPRPYGAVVRTGKVGIGESVGVWGVGGLGTHMVQLARLVGAAPIIAVDIKPAILDRALAVGADYAFDARDDALPRQDRRGHRRPQPRRRVRRRRAEVHLRAGAGQPDRRRPAGRRRHERRRPVDRADVDLQPVQAAGARPPRLPERRHRHAGQPGVAGPARPVAARSATIVPLEDVARGIEKLDKADGDPIRILVQP